MVKFTICTMVKNEDDIIKEWIEYYGNIFGFNNLYIIDNYSTDNTYNICEEYLSKGINLIRKIDYGKKGEYMTYYLNNTDCDIFIPLDIDEFMCYYDKKNNTVNKNNIITYLESLLDLEDSIFKMNYINPINTTDEDGLQKFTHGEILDYNSVAKTFVIKKNLNKKFVFDHGNHVNTKNYILTDLFLIHYHQRSHEQVYKKCEANVTGFGYSLDLNSLKELSMRKKEGFSGQHRVNQMIYIKENPDDDLSPPINTNISDNWIYIKDIFEPIIQNLHEQSYIINNKDK